jgi:hypothetical protein
MRECILLDNKSTAIAFCNKKNLQDIKESNEEIVLSTIGRDVNISEAIVYLDSSRIDAKTATCNILH